MALSSRVFVRGLPPCLTVEDLRKHFSQQSPVTDARLISHRRIGYVGFRTPEDAARAVKYHDRSFIRMSKIGVELARSIDRQQQAPRPHETGTSTSKPNMTDRATEHQGNGDEALDMTIPARKRRRLSADYNERDKKFQDFLGVMQPPSKSRAWDDQDLLAIAPKSPPPMEPKLQTMVVADDKSDGEYEPVPRKSDKSTEEPNDLPNDVPKEHIVPLTDGAVGAHSKIQVDGGVTLQSDLEVPPTLTDDDWLRSRTSRLLGLVDDDETLAMKIPKATNDEAEDRLDKEMPGMVGERQSGVAAQMEKWTESEILNNEISTSAEVEEPIVSNGRLFLRNLTYTTTEDELRNYFEGHGFERIKEIHLPLDFRSGNGNNKGFAHVQFIDQESATRALKTLDQKPFQGRLLHILHSDSKPGLLDEISISKLPLKKQQHLRRQVEAASSTFNWNSMYMSSDAVISSISDRLGVAKTDLLDPTSSDTAVKQAHAETHIIQETKSYFKTNGVDLDAFRKSVRGNTTVLIKNFPFGTNAEELRSLFDAHGPLKQLLMPPSGTIAIVEFHQAHHARSAFSSLSYSKFKGSVLFLEKAPKDLFAISNSKDQVDGVGCGARQAKPLTTELLDIDRPASVNTTTLFVKNLNFATTGKRLREAFQAIDGFMSARVKTKSDPKKKGQTLSMGFGFLEFRSKEQAQVALAAMDGYKLDGHELLIRISHKAIDAAEEKRNEDQAKKVAGRKTKIIIKNLPFEATKKDVRSLFGAYGQLRSVRVPKKFDSSTRGFAFADFITAREAESAMDALKDTHLLGRRLVLQFAAEAEIDPEAKIEQMQKKVGMQADKVALQKLTGTGRRKFNVEGADQHDQLVD